MRTVKSIVEESRKLNAWDRAPYISQHLPEAFPVNAVRMWRLGDPFSQKGRRILIGVATYDLPELRALAELIDAVRHTPATNETIDVFDTAACRSMEDFQHYVPGVGPALHPPIVGVWEDGELNQKASGAEARKLLTKHFGLDASVWSDSPWDRTRQE
jgi:hypothetical protein